MEVSSSSMKVARVTVRAMTQWLIGFRATARGSALACSEMVAVGDIFRIETYRSLFLDAGIPKRNRKVSNSFEEIVEEEEGPYAGGRGFRIFWRKRVCGSGFRGSGRGGRGRRGGVGRSFRSG